MKSLVLKTGRNSNIVDLLKCVIYDSVLSQLCFNELKSESFSCRLFLVSNSRISELLKL